MLSVALCTAMVIIVLSVMGGFLDMLTEAGRVLIGDVSVQAGLTGFPHYEELMDEIQELPEASAVAATVEGYGLVKMPSRNITPVSLIGIDGSSFDAVTDFKGTLFWRPLNDEDLDVVDPGDSRFPEPDATEAQQSRINSILESMHAAGMSLQGRDDRPGAVLGMEISRNNNRLKLNSYSVFGSPLPGHTVTISVIPVTQDGGLVAQAETRVFEVVNEFVAGRYDVDSKTIYVPFDMLQDMLKMNAKERLLEAELDENGDPVLDEFDEPIRRRVFSPARASRILVKASDGVTPEQLSTSIQAAIAKVQNRHPESRMYVEPMTWEQQIEGFIGAVKKETALVTTLFSIISLVSVFLVLAIFWTIVQQKTRDVGILRAVGASRVGIAWLFLRYGLILGIIGVLLGAVLAHAVVWNINPLHEWIGKITGQFIWDPKVYYFNELPHDVNGKSALIIMTGGVIFSILGALIPAIRAAYVDPVASLRYE